ncbi:nucleotidyl transferase AbiEii/AbiGii toxin family protein [Patescibacteria group bacterium]|nr:nucleotidyl transferase AbiEii/AbiGii toxin family protein [Patescibacteria group bacterium]
MLNQYLIEKLSEDLKIAPLNIIREYLEMEVLYYLSQSKLSENIIFYGGTALRLAYQSFRFSEDLDFLLVKKTKSNKKEIKKVLQSVIQENKGVTVEEVFEKQWTILGLLHIKNELLKHPIRIKIEISKKKDGIQAKNLLLSSPISIKEVIFKTATTGSFYKLKQEAIKDRNKPRDWFDYWYLSQKLHRDTAIDKEFPFNKKEFTNELKRWLPRNKWGIIETVIKFYQ